MLILKIVILVVLSQGCATVYEGNGWEVKVKVLPPPKTFFEKAFPHVEPEIPSQGNHFMTPWRRPPLQVV